MKTHHPVKEMCEITAKPNILKMIKNREYGIIKHFSFQSQVTKLKVKQLKRSDDNFEIDPDISHCKFLRTGDTGCIIGVWQKDMGPASKHSAIYHLKFLYNREYYLCDKYGFCPMVADLFCYGPVFKRLDITDSCEIYIGGRIFLLYVGNTAVSGGRIILNINNGTEHVSFNDHQETIWRRRKPILSCASNVYSERFAAGTEDGFYLFDTQSFMEVNGLSGDVLSVEFSRNGNLLYCGLDKNEFFFCDLRDLVWQVGDLPIGRLGLNGVKEMKLLSDERTMIVSLIDGNLWKMDLRMRRPVFQYPGITNKTGRRPVSVDEGFDLLCGTGDDNCTRIWSLRSGELLKSISPFRRDTSCHACLIAERGRWFVAAVHGGNLSPFYHSYVECDL